MDRVRSMEDEHIIPLGRLQFEEIVSLLGQADIYCFPTDYPEGFPTVVLEAAAAGVLCDHHRQGRFKRVNL